MRPPERRDSGPRPLADTPDARLRESANWLNVTPDIVRGWIVGGLLRPSRAGLTAEDLLRFCDQFPDDHALGVIEAAGGFEGLPEPYAGSAADKFAEERKRLAAAKIAAEPSSKPKTKREKKG